MTRTLAKLILPPVRLPSIRAVVDDAARTLRRFPLVLLSAAVAAVAANLLIGKRSSDTGLMAALAASTLGLPLFVAIELTTERLESRAARLLLLGLGVLALVSIGIAWPHWTEAVQWRRYAQFSLVAHLLVAFLPYAAARDTNAFWQYNRTLFLRFLLSGLYSAVLFAGLSAALLAIDKLLQVRVPENAYARLWIGIAFVFNTWFFLGGIPPLPSLESRRDYPQALKVFSQFILLPLVAIYLSILTAYLARILITGQWPSGSIGNLVSAVAAVGILSLLLVHPIRDREENRWVATYARWFYVALLPAIGMLLVAVWKRIDQYGVTEDRYFIAILSLWLAGIAVTFIARRSADIRIIPVTLCILAFVTAFGPTGAYAVSRRSQIAHLRQLLTRQGLLEGGAAHRAETPIPISSRRELSSTVLYLMKTHGSAWVRPLIGETLAVSDKDTTRDRYDIKADRRARAFMQRFGMEFVNAWQTDSANFSFNQWDPSRFEAVAIAGIDYHVPLNYMLPARFTLEGTSWDLRSDGRARHVVLSRAGQPMLAFPMDTMIAFARASSGQFDKNNPLRLDARSDQARALLILRNFGGTIAADTVQLGNLQGDLYLTLTAPPAARSPNGR